MHRAAALLEHAKQTLEKAQPEFKHNQRTTPEVAGSISMVSADVTRDQKSSAYFYTARVSVSEDEIAKLGPLKLVAGMPVEAFVKTGDRSVVFYLVRPMSRCR